MAEVAGKVVHCKKEEFDLYIGRNADHHGFLSKDAGTPNPYPLGPSTSRYSAISLFEPYARKKIMEDPEYRERVKGLYGKTLGCWCKPLRCHGDILLKLAAELQP